MCGIAGYFVEQTGVIRPEALQALARGLLLGIESRGRHATGLAYVSVKDRHTYICKEAVTASDFIKAPGHILSKATVKAMPRSMLLHTRFFTQGSPENNKNNHPVYSKRTGLCIIHNGWILEEDKLIKEYALKKDAEVDTESYLRMIETFYLKDEKHSIIEAINSASEKTNGVMACGLVHSGDPTHMWIWRNMNPLAIAHTEWGYVFASTEESILRGIYAPGCKAYDISGFQMQTVPEDTLIELNAVTRELIHIKLKAPPVSTSTQGKWTRYNRGTEVYDMWCGADGSYAGRVASGPGATNGTPGTGSNSNGSPTQGDHSKEGKYYFD